MTSGDPFAALSAALHDISQNKINTLSLVRLDLGRRARTGVPEIILGGIKPAMEIAGSLRRLAMAEGRALASRIDPATAATIEDELGSQLASRYDALGRMLIVAQLNFDPEKTGGRVGVITAGSSDAPIAREAALVAAEMGCTVTEAFDVGVAGLHRLVVPLRRMIVDEDVDVLVIAAGMDGVLPSVVSGLVAVPIVAVPTSTGYGHGGSGAGALTTMLQTCSPGVAVVNIDNGVGAGVMAGLIAMRAGRARLDQTQKA